LCSARNCDPLSELTCASIFRSDRYNQVE
jgi:hypothetical protein